MMCTVAQCTMVLQHARGPHGHAGQARAALAPQGQPACKARVARPVRGGAPGIRIGLAAAQKYAIAMTALQGTVAVWDAACVGQRRMQAHASHYKHAAELGKANGRHMYVRTLVVREQGGSELRMREISSVASKWIRRLENKVRMRESSRAAYVQMNLPLEPGLTLNSAWGENSVSDTIRGSI